MTHPVDDEHLAAHVLARRAREEHDGARKVPRLAPPSRGDALRDLAQPHRVLQQLLVPITGEESCKVSASSMSFSQRQSDRMKRRSD